jgi:pseudaminic acid synthase
VVAFESRIIRKDFTLSRQISRPDSAFSLELQEFKAIVEAIRETEKALGQVCYEMSEHEKAIRVFRRSFFVVEDVVNGEQLLRKMSGSI